MRRWRLGLGIVSVLAVGLVLQTGIARARVATVFIAFGDSITDGFGEPSGDGYPKRLQKKLKKEFDAEVRKFGLASEDSGEALSRINAVLDTGGDVLLLMEGTNDVTKIFDGLISRETTIANLDDMARRAKQRGMETVHATLMPRPRKARRDINNFVTRGVSFAIRELAFERKRRLVDIYQAFDPEVVEDTASFYFAGSDPVGHPNAEGYDRIAEFFADVLLGVDSVPPVMGDFTPGFAELIPGGEIRRNEEIRISLYEPKDSSGIDLENAQLVINGVVVGEAEGNERKIELVHKGAKALGCRAHVSVVVPDQSIPEANVFERTMAVYAIKNRTVIKGDVDFDCRVDGEDLGLFGLRFGARRGTRRYNSSFDFNGDDEIDGGDLAFLARNFGKISR